MTVYDFLAALERGGYRVTLENNRPVVTPTAPPSVRATAEAFAEELARVLTPAAPAEDPVSRAVCELLARFELGEYRNRPAVQRRLADIFRADPPDALERLEAAAAHLGVTGEHADALLDDLLTAWPTTLLEGPQPSSLEGTSHKIASGKRVSS